MPTPKKNESKQDYLKRCTSDLVGSEGRSTEQAYAVCNRYWDDAKGKRATLSLTAPLELGKAEGAQDGEKPGFLITAYTGSPIDQFWGKLYIDVAGIETKEKIPILREHYRDRVVGYSTKQWKEDNNLFVAGEFSSATRDGKEVLALAEEGYPWQASVSVRPQKVKVLESNKETAEVNGQEVTGPGEVWMKSKVGEVSFVSLGADDNTAAIVMSDDKVSVELETSTTGTGWNYYFTKEDEPMNLKELKEQYAELYQEIFDEGKDSVGLDEAVAKAKAEGIEEERKRVTEILDAEADTEATLKAIKEGVAAESAFKLFYEAEKEKRAKGLEELKAQAPENIGTEQPKEPEKKDDRPAEEILSEKAIELAEKEGIDLATAQIRVIEANPELAKNLFPSPTA